jgi:hypothetical protein
MFISHACEPVVGALLWGPIVGDTSVVDYPNVALFLADLSSAHGYLSIVRGATWSLVIPLLSTISCKVTGLSAEETCENFPLSVFLDGSSWISSFSTSSYTLFVSVSSWEEIFCFGYSSVCSSWRSVHGIWITLRISPLAVERLPGISGWWPFCFKTVGPVPHVNVNSLLVDCRRSPLFVCCGLWEGS